jgi:hypothetical protein
MEWDQYRRADGTIDLHRAYRETFGALHPKASMFLGLIETLQPINSRQAAAQALATANALAEA